jgi:hypothetical protein
MKDMNSRLTVKMGLNLNHLLGFSAAREPGVLQSGQDHINELLKTKAKALEIDRRSQSSQSSVSKDSESASTVRDAPMITISDQHRAKSTTPSEPKKSLRK